MYTDIEQIQILADAALAAIQAGTDADKIAKIQARAEIALLANIAQDIRAAREAFVKVK